MKTIKLFFDFEFTSLSPDTQPISLGIVSDEIVTEYGCPRCKGGEVEKMYDSYHYQCKDCKEKIAARDHIKGIDKASKTFYSEFTDFDSNRCDDWVKENVVRKLQFGKETHDGSSDYTENWDMRLATDQIKSKLSKWLDQFKDYQIQFVCDCGTFDWYWMLQLLAEWEHVFDLSDKYADRFKVMRSIPLKTGLPKLPKNISPVPQDLNDLIAFKKGITPAEAFDLNREEMAFRGAKWSELIDYSAKHNALNDALVIKEIYNKLI